MDSSRHNVTPTVGIITALPEEFAAVEKMLDNIQPYTAGIRGIRQYTLGEIPSQHGGAHLVALTLLPTMGTNMAAAQAATLLERFPSVRHLLMVGIAAAAPNPAHADEHVRLGDIVVSGASGIVQYDFVAEKLTETVYRSPPRPPSAELTQAVRLLAAAELKGARPWESLIARACDLPLSTRPSEEFDVLKVDGIIVPHPADHRRQSGFPRVFAGSIASANTLLRNPGKRDLIREKFGVRAFEMEGSGIGDASWAAEIGCLVVRGTCDYADSEKNDTWHTYAAIVAAAYARALLSSVPTESQLTPKPARTIPANWSPDLGQKALAVHRTCLDSFLSKFWNEHGDLIREHFPDSLWMDYSKLFAMLARPDGLTWHKADQMIAEVANFVESSSRDYPLKVTGSAGSGKSTFLSLLFLKMRQKWLDNEGKSAFPVYINLQRYESTIYDSPTGLDLEKHAQKACADDLRPLRELIQSAPSLPYIVIVDGLGENAKFNACTLATVEDVLRGAKHRKLLGERLPRGGQPSHSESRRQREPAAKLDLGSVILESPNARTFTETWCRLAGMPERSADVLSLARKFALSELDVFTVSRLARDALRTDATFSEVLYRFCFNWLKAHEISSPHSAIAEASKLAFERAILRRKYPGEELRSIPYWGLVHEHHVVEGFLVARYVADAFEKYASNETANVPELEHVYPYYVNRFCKDLICAPNPDAKTRGVHEAICRLLTDEKLESLSDLRRKTHAAYLAGRLTEDSWVHAVDALQRLETTLATRKPWASTEECAGAWALLQRTVIISLISLRADGDADNSRCQAYIKKLMENRTWERVNRGFHLEYYGDVPFDPLQPLRSKDKLDDCPRTFATLRAKIADGPEKRALFELEVFTLACLAQQRHVKGRLAEKDRTDILETLQGVLKKGVLGAESLRHAKMVARHLSMRDFRIGALAEEIFKIKSTLRAGWVQRGLTATESVADHTLGAVLLAMLYLPRNLSDKAPEKDRKEYNKDSVIRTLLLHDLAEAYTGDILSHKKTGLDRELEEEQIAYLQTLGTYSGVGGFESISDSWSDIEGGGTINGRIAKDFDRLDNLVQLYIYRDRGDRIEDFDSWKSSLSMATSEGQRVALLLKEHFERRHQVQ